MSARRKVAVVIPVHGALDKLTRCLEVLTAIRCQTRFDIILCDDATPGGLGDIPKTFGITRVHRRSTRGGFSIAINDLFRLTFAEYDACVNLHSDMVMLEGSLEALMERWYGRPRAGIIGGMELAPDDPDLIVCGGSRPILTDGRLTNILLLDREGRLSSGDWQIPEQVEWIPWGLVSKRCFDEVGLADEALVNYFSDVDLCYRASLAGLEVWYEPAYRVIHDRHTSTRLHRLRGLMSFQEDKERFCGKWFPGVLEPARDERSWAVRLENRDDFWRPRLIPHLVSNAPIPEAARDCLVSDSATALDLNRVRDLGPTEPMNKSQRSAFRRLYLKGLSYADLGTAVPKDNEAFLNEIDLVVLAPHCDDAALSIGGLLLARSSSRARTRIHTLFGRSNYAIGPLGELPAPMITKVRMLEEAAYCASIGAEYEVMDLPDRLLRVPHAPILLEEADQLEVELVARVAALIPERIEGPTAPVILAPLAAGLMADHAVVAAAVALLVRYGYPEQAVLVYDDLPYATRPGAVGLGRDLYRKLGLELTPVTFDVTKWFETKCELLSIYASQASPTFLDSVERHGQAVAIAPGTGLAEPWRRAERLWRVRRIDGRNG